MRHPVEGAYLNEREFRIDVEHSAADHIVEFESAQMLAIEELTWLVPRTFQAVA